MKLKKIYLASPRGFCAGVKRAIKTLDLVLKKHGPPIYVRHQIVHNKQVVADFTKKGAIFVEDIEEAPNKSIIVFSAHGSSPELNQTAKKKNLLVYDAVCPLVTKVHIEAKKYYQQGYYIFYIGHKNHAEALGIVGEVPSDVLTLIQTRKDAEAVYPPQKNKLIVLTQTTLSFDDTGEIVKILKNRFPSLILPPAFDICYSTQNRQNAVKKLAKFVKVIFVVGSKNSSNSNRLKEVAIKSGAKAYLIDRYSEINTSWLSNVDAVGITAGASVPENLIDELISYLSNSQTKIEEIKTAEENINFPVPSNL